MTNECPEVRPNGRYSQAETSRLLGVTAQTLRNWEAKGYISFERRKVGRGKVMKGIQIIKIWQTMSVV